MPTEIEPCIPLLCQWVLQWYWMVTPAVLIVCENEVPTLVKMKPESNAPFSAVTVWAASEVACTHCTVSPGLMVTSLGLKAKSTICTVTVLAIGGSAGEEWPPPQAASDSSPAAAAQRENRWGWNMTYLRPSSILRVRCIGGLPPRVAVPRAPPWPRWTCSSSPRACRYVLRGGRRVLPPAASRHSRLPRPDGGAGVNFRPRSGYILTT